MRLAELLKEYGAEVRMKAKSVEHIIKQVMDGHPT